MKQKELFRDLLIGTMGGIISGIFLAVFEAISPQRPQFAYLIALFVCAVFFALIFIALLLIFSTMKK